MYTSLVQFFNPKLRFIGNDESLLALDALRDIYALAFHNIKLSKEKQVDKFPAYPIPEFNVEDLLQC